MKQTIYYAVFDGSNYLESGKNSNDKNSVKENILSLIEPETDDEDFSELEAMTIEEILSIKGWELHESNVPYYSDYDTTTPVKDAGQSDKQENRKTTYPEYVLPKDCDYPLIKQEQTETGGTRFFTQDLDEETNIPDLKGWVEKRVLDGLGDETKAGIIGYIHHEHIQEIATILNNFPAMFEALKDCLKCLTMDSDMEEDFAPEIKKAKAILTSINKH